MAINPYSAPTPTFAPPPMQLAALPDIGVGAPGTQINWAGGANDQANALKGQPTQTIIKEDDDDDD